jgi:hypothetical protein
VRRDQILNLEGTKGVGVQKEIYPVTAWDGILPNCVIMEEMLDLCGNGTDVERWVVCVCVCVCRGTRMGKGEVF